MGDSIRSPAPVRLVALWFAAAAGVWLALAGFIALIDPYAIFGSPRIAGVNAAKFEMAEFGRVAKLREVRRHQPQAIILGDSQAEAGFRAATVARLTGMKTYNLSFLGARIEEVEIAFSYALRYAPIRTAVIGLDYVAFEGGSARVPLLRARIDDRSLQTLRDFAELTLSMQGLVAAVRNVAFNRLGRTPSHNDAGDWSAPDAASIDDNAPPVAALTPADAAYRAFETICETAAARGIELKLVATPVHNAFGLDPAARGAWIVRLRNIAAKHGFAILDEGADAGFNADKRNFFDRGHFTPQAGEAMLGRAFGAPPQTRMN